MDQYHLFAFAKIHAGISLQPLSTPTAEFSLRHVYTMLHLLCTNARFRHLPHESISNLVVKIQGKLHTPQFFFIF